MAGRILGKAAVYSGKNAVQTQSYGAEARGSAAKSDIIIADERIGFPIVRKCDVLIAMSQEAIRRNVKDLNEGCVLLVDSSIVKDIPDIKGRTLKISASEVAESAFGERLFANMIMLGALNETTKLLDHDSIIEAIRDTVPEKAISTNTQAFIKGRELAR